MPKQILDPSRKLHRKLDDVSSVPHPPLNVRVRWSKKAQSYLEQSPTILSEKKIIEQDSEAVAFLCLSLLKADKVKILAPLHEFTDRRTTTTDPHITISIRWKAPKRERVYHATYERLPGTGNLVLQWLTYKRNSNIIYFDAAVS
jgi:hypothetical protein